MRVFDKMVKARKLVQIGEKQELMKDGRKGRPVPVWDLSEEARIEALVDVE
jgi:ribosomal protein L39E